MPQMITEACVNCGACLHGCPNDGIRRGENRVVLDATLCTECVGFYSSEQCAAVCPIEGACIPDPNNVQTEAALFELAKEIHARSPTPPVLSYKTSHLHAADAPKWWERLVPLLKNLVRDVPKVEDT